jgi:hypothetical protein
VSIKLKEEIPLLVTLLLAKVDILKLKADDYNWKCHTPQTVKEQLEIALNKIDEFTEALTETPQLKEGKKP